MKVMKFIKLLNQENKDAEIIAYLANKKGWQMAELGYNDAILGKTKTGKKDFVLVPIEIPDQLEEWQDGEESFGICPQCECERN